MVIFYFISLFKSSINLNGFFGVIIKLFSFFVVINTPSSKLLMATDALPIPGK